MAGVWRPSPLHPEEIHIQRGPPSRIDVPATLANSRYGQNPTSAFVPPNFPAQSLPPSTA